MNFVGRVEGIRLEHQLHLFADWDFAAKAHVQILGIWYPETIRGCAWNVSSRERRRIDESAGNVRIVIRIADGIYNPASLAVTISYRQWSASGNAEYTGNLPAACHSTQNRVIEIPVASFAER